jgi:hypothetical protein
MSGGGRGKVTRSSIVWGVTGCKTKEAILENRPQGTKHLFSAACQDKSQYDMIMLYVLHNFIDLICS